MKNALRCLLSALMIGAGLYHFIRPEPFVKIVPDFLPAHRVLVYLSGFFEILGGVGLQIGRVRKASAWGLVALFMAVFPANVNMAVNKITLGIPALGNPLLLWGRLPFQAVLIAWAWWYTRSDAKR